MIEAVFAFSEPLASDVEAIVELVHLYAKHGHAPDYFGRAKSMKGKLAELRQQAAEGSISISFEREHEPKMSTRIYAYDEPREGSGSGAFVSVSVSPSPKTVELLLALASWGHVLYGAGHDDYELAHIDRDSWQSSSQTPIELRAVFQYNVLGKKLVEKLGKKRVMSTPDVKIRELPNGAVFIDAGTSAAVHAKAFEHLTGKSAPKREIPKRVKPDWDPEMAPVFATLVERESLEDRNAFITKLNKLKPAKPETVSPPRGSNVADPAKSIRTYRSVADELVVLLHDKEPALGSNAGPDVLPLLDVHFYGEDYPGTFGAEKTALLLRPLGAWLGELLVRELDGEWAPRGKMDEIEVVVGKTAFLPMLRAKQYLASKDAVLEYSLTKYFADAKKLAKKK